MDKKTLAIVSYITIIGWAIAYIQFNKSESKDALVRYHLKQALGVALISIVISLVVNLLAHFSPAFATIAYVQWGVLVLWILGILNANNGQMKPVPVVGRLFEDKFIFLN
ncbi:DUF4870 domain-containing protein [Chitinophaga nivalis]|uniref:DUF4870 domain-containing protein n=1 Tax=Chitinophaga nivalis TaxID=2991709 RepID=A0ABT3IIG6_9BACT|nr:DUF4870 domain-containing protein [Chitinophaga nivalis]MCW3466714.1 DUF4870 domain-containing protein [Chitinophaga nivalis]MCW3483595.1 DUF4870 domain-containing protein [Chitinophaga nivalis]